ncbi:universal stress protein [Gellertiella hungarica]|uniref:Nucleotide-binding universal stress UspA family protein n=1 Tax=Gellertiella hungarica TaxID=1572859 RepID=A0A7W6J593_9HYPH|nr:universal stress protein [Gellertiella hungarica]MBB4065038.1 nucleotide-binding universal stress UspA family protein [Gellertiella hungarica]
MAYKTIVCVLSNARNADNLLQCAIDQARRNDAHLIGLHVEQVSIAPLAAPMAMPDPVSIQALQDAARETSNELKGIFEEACRREGISCDWRNVVSMSGYGAGSSTDILRCADLIVAAQADPSYASDDSEIEQVLFESGRPVLLVPYIFTTAKPINRVLIGWNGTREATRAVFDALPFLKKAQSVEVFTVDPETSGDQAADLAGAELAATLARHGIKVNVVAVASEGLSPATVLENRLSDASIDLLVIGAYGKSRLREMLFGGVTRTLLDSMTALTLMSR